tara:strand:+ start:1474 stop:3399 length:1926 start_codon:yes stop_codon:yes gene_type:complete
MAGYTRQSSFADGDIITAADSNDEFNQLLSSFNNTTGHKHDGTAAEGPVIGLIGDPGVATPKNKVVVDDTNNQVEFNIDVSGTSTEQFVVKDGVIEPTTNNDIDLGSSSKKFKDLNIAGAANIAGTMTLSGNVIVSGTLGADLIPDGDNTRDIGSSSAEWKDLYIDGVAYLDAINFNGTAISATAAELNILDGVTSTTAELNILDGVTSTAAELNILDGVTSTTAELNILDGVTATTAELNLTDGGSTVGTTAVAGGDGILTNDNGTMRQTSVDTFDTYLAQSTKTLTNKTLTTPTITTPVVNAGLQLKNGATSAGFAEFFEDSDNGTNKVTLIGPASTADVTVTLPAATDTLVGKATTDTLTNKTLTSAVLNGTISGTSIKDEDNMASDSATHLATQQSIKAYVDAEVAALPSGDITSVVAGAGMTGGGTSGAVTLDVAGGTGITANANDIAIDATVATLTGTQTLTNKSITAPILTGSASSAGSILFKEDTDNGTNAVTLIGPAATADVTVTLPAATDTLVGKATTDTLTNKSIDAAQLTGTVANARLDAQLQDVAGLAVTDGGFIVGDGSNFVLETAGTARTSLGLGTAAVLNTGTSAGNAIVLDGSARLPGVDGSQLTNLPSAGATAGFAVAMAIAL